MKYKLVFVCMIAIIIQSCFWRHEDVNCQAVEYIVINNNTYNSLKVNFHRNASDNSSWIDSFGVNEMVIDSGKFAENAIYFRWKGTDRCTMFCHDDYGWNSTIIIVSIGDSIVQRTVIYPCDSIKQAFVDTCENCLRIIYDTLIIQ